jgi:formylglycine-generating enzyme required for sulfatase activity
MRNLFGVIISLCFLTGMPTQTQATEQDSKPVQTIRDCQDCPEMVVIPTGNLYMGKGTKLASLTEDGPLGKKGGIVTFDHLVTISKSFAMGKTEVTQGQWRALMGNNPSIFNHCGDTCPVENVSWWDVQDFIQKLNVKTGKQYRLPSEAEWEYACHAGGRETYCGNNNVDSVAWYESISKGTTHPVATKQGNAWGLYDMSGNLLEWVQDDWHKHFNGAPVDGSAWQGDGENHVVRGGASNDSSRNVTSYSRNYYGVYDRDSNIGFRLARMLP